MTVQIKYQRKKIELNKIQKTKNSQVDYIWQRKEEGTQRYNPQISTFRGDLEKEASMEEILLETQNN